MKKTLLFLTAAFLLGVGLGTPLGYLATTATSRPPVERLLDDVEWGREHWPQGERLKTLSELKHELDKPIPGDSRHHAMTVLSKLANEELDNEVRRAAKECLVKTIR